MITLFNIPVKRILVIALLALTGCKDTDKNSSLIFEELNESLERSNSTIRVSTSIVLNDLKQKLQEPSSEERADLWMRKAKMIFDASNSLQNFIDSLKRAIKVEERKNSYAPKAEAAAVEILINQKNGNRLFDSLKNYRMFLFAVDENLERVFRESSNYSDTFFLSKSKSAKEFNTNLFEQASVIKAICLLAKIKNTVLIVENELIMFCRNNVPNSFCGYNEILPIAFQNSNRFSPGEELEINVGIGSFSLNNKPTFIINNLKIEPSENGAAIFKMKVEKKAGKYSVPVYVEYTMPDGTKSRLQKFMEYTVVE